jgi:hypothetical protein
MDRNKLSAIVLMLMAVLGALVFLFILGGGLMRALFGGGAETSGIVIVTGSSVRLGLVMVLAAIVIAVAFVLYRIVRR